MAELIDPSELMFKTFQPKQSHRFIMYVDGIPAFMIKDVDRPNVTNTKVTLDHINTKRHVTGKAEWQDITLTLYDPIVPSGVQATMEWFRLHYESVTGRAGYADFYKKDVTINVLGPIGDKVEEWTLKGALITTLTPSKMDWATDDFSTVTLGLAYDYAILQF
jgi:hypothetical protein